MPVDSVHILRCKNVVVRFGGIYALNGVDLSVITGSINAIIGPNGAGKTTLLNAISGLISINKGRIEFMGKDITNIPSHERAKYGRGNAGSARRG